jgi:hypothetical protein
LIVSDPVPTCAVAIYSPVIRKIVYCSVLCGSLKPASAPTAPFDQARKARMPIYQGGTCDTVVEPLATQGPFQAYAVIDGRPLMASVKKSNSSLPLP